MIEDTDRRLRILSTFLRVYGVLSLLVFVPLMIGVMGQWHMLDEHGGSLNWTIWNSTRSGDQPAHVPPMLFIIYITWSVFLFLAARRPEVYTSFLSFTMWANLAHGLLMVIQAALDLDRYWSKFFTDIPFLLLLSLGIYLLRPPADRAPASVAT